jgi:hypothetical protein
MARFIKTVNGKIGLTNILVISVKAKVTYYEIYKFSQTYLVMPHRKYRGKKNATVYAALANDWSNKERRAEKKWLQDVEEDLNIFHAGIKRLKQNRDCKEMGFERS